MLNGCITSVNSDLKQKNILNRLQIYNINIENQ